MRAPGILLLLLAVFATVAWPRVREHVSNPPEEVLAVAQFPDGRYWRYSEHAPFHDYLATDLQQFASTDPHETAARVCREFGGEVGHIASSHEGMTSVAFLCRFTEPDVTMSVDFGELDRIPKP